MTVLSGFQPMPTAPACPYCSGTYFCVEDDGNPDSYLVRCWCGAKCRCNKDDPDMVEWLASHATRKDSGEDS